MTPAAQAEETPPIDYSKLNFQVSLKSLRSGNHDEKGQNEYYLKSTLIGLPLLKEDAKKPFAERKKIERPLGEFSQIKIPNLKYWAGEKKLGPPFLQSVSGETIREVVGETMRTYKAEEELVSILYKLEMYERNKLFGLVGEDTKVGVTEFFIIPEVPPRAPKVENQVLQISDTQGLRVELQITFASLETKKP
jgi:hypothetical protein